MLNLLTFTDEIWNIPSFDNVAIIGAQHIMESTFHLFLNLKNKGLDPSKTFLMGKCYSTSESVFHDFQEEGFYLSELSFSFDSHESYDVSYKRNIAQFVADSISKIDFSKIDKLIVLDDGGYLIDEINKNPDIKIPVISIEQTSAGIHYLSKVDLNIPVINVARSKGKLELETPFIVESSLNRFFEYVPKSMLATQNVLILGYGTIGAAVAKTLASSCQVEVFDPRFHPSSLLNETLKRAHVVLGCSGTISLKYNQYKLLKDGTVLASFSSSDREFEAHHFRKLFPQTGNCKSSFNNQRILLLQSGFPINFWGSRNNIPVEKIQITLALLQSAIYQALNMEGYQQGIICLDEESERLIMLKFQNFVVENGRFETELIHKNI